MQTCRVWGPVVLLGLVLAIAQAGGQELARPVPDGPKDKQIETEKPVLRSPTNILISAELPSADKVLAQAEAKALAEQKTIFVYFSSSWCAWCGKLDAFLERPDIKPVFERFFVPVRLVVEEGEKNKALENPGGEALLKKLGGPAGLPYCAFLNAQGVLIVNSKRDGQNIGYPGEPVEIEWFVQMIRKAAPKISDQDAKTIDTALRPPKKA